MRLLGKPPDGGTPVLYPYLSVFAALIGGGAIAAALRGLKRLAREILISGS